MNFKALKAGIWYTISNFLVKGLIFLTTPIFTRLMDKNDIGIFSNITSWFAILTIITTFELYSSISIARFDYKNNINEYISSTLLLGSFITGIFYVIALVFHNFFESLFCVDFITLNIMFIYLLFYPSVQMFQLNKQINYEYKQSMIISIISAILSTLLSIILVLLFNNKLYGRIIGYFIPSIIISIIIYIYLICKSKKITKKYWNYALKISFPLIFHLLAGYLLTSSDKIMITKIISPEANALYSVAYIISMIVNILWYSMNMAWSPWAYEQMDKRCYSNLKETSKPYFIFFLFLVSFFMLIVPETLWIMGGNSYMEAKYVMPPVMVGYIFQFVYSLYVNIEFYHKKQKNIAIGTILAALINISLNAIFIPLFGYIAAAYTTLVGYVLLYIIHYSFVKKLKCDDWYDTSFFIKLLCISICYMFLCNILYSCNIIRYILICCIFIVGFYFVIKNIKGIIKMIKSKSLDQLLLFINRKKEIK